MDSGLTSSSGTGVSLVREMLMSMVPTFLPSWLRRSKNFRLYLGSVDCFFNFFLKFLRDKTAVPSWAFLLGDESGVRWGWLLELVRFNEGDLKRQLEEMLHFLRVGFELDGLPEAKLILPAGSDRPNGDGVLA